jgi:hypothetical protein
VLGREFGYELLEAFIGDQERALRDALDKLVGEELLHQRGLPPRSTYIFRHALIRDAAYESLLRTRRQEYHLRAAELLAAQFPDVLENQPELLAQHFTEAGAISDAVDWWARAGELSIHRSANVEAAAQLTAALDLLSDGPAIDGRDERELSVLSLLAVAHIAAKGYAAPEVGSAYERARELVSMVDDPLRFFPALHGICRYYTTRGDHATAEGLGEKLLSLANGTDDVGLQMEAHRAMGHVLWSVGKQQLAVEHLDSAIASYDAGTHRSHALHYGGDPQVMCLGFSAVAKTILGFPEQGLERSERALSSPHARDHPLTGAFALAFRAYVLQLCGDLAGVRDVAEELIAQAREQYMPYWLAAGTVLHGWAVALQGDPRAGVDEMMVALDLFARAGTDNLMPYVSTAVEESP